MQLARVDRRTRLTAAFSAAVLAACLLIVAVVPVDRGTVLDPLVLVLAAAGLVSNVASARWEGSLLVSGGFAADMLAAALLGPLPALVVAAVAEAGAWTIAPSRRLYLLNNLAAGVAPALAAGVAMAALSLDPDGTLFYVAFAAVAGGAYALHIAVYAIQARLLSAARLRRTIAVVVPTLSSEALSIALAVPLAWFLHRAGVPAGLLLLAVIASYARMARLLVLARDNARAHAALSWGVLSGLLRALELREPNAARHAAAVAAFSRDIARACGMARRDVELVHTAGLLHDIGLLAPSPGTVREGVPLDEHDWEAIRMHPVVGAELLRDLTLYGPVAEIVRAHHERVDGRGYPDGLEGDAIPELAKVVAVAEVYDTLTAEGGYRGPASSFEALAELRRVAGTQLEPRYVEALAGLLAGRDTGFRHADEADFSTELDLERRIAQAAGHRVPPREPAL